MASVYKRGGKQNRAGYYYVSWADHTGKRRSKCTRTTDKATAERIAGKYEADAATRREGLIDPQAEIFAKELNRPLNELIAEYGVKLKSMGRDKRYVADSIGYIERIAKSSGFATVREITPQAIEQFGVELLRIGRSARTVQAALGAMKSFTRWLTTTGRLQRDPLACVRKPNPEADRRRERRMLLREEWQHLDAATRIGPRHSGMDGPERALLYRLAIQTGLRSNELRSLACESVFLEAKRPYVLVKARDTKNGMAAQQFVDTGLANSLRQLIVTKMPKDKLFSMPDRTRLAKMLRSDLAAARTAWIAESDSDPREHHRRAQSDFLAAMNHAGQVFDFHSLRHTCGAWLAQSGAHVKTVQSVMRHSTIVLTMDTYGHLLPGAEAEAADQLASMFTAPAQATGFRPAPDPDVGLIPNNSPQRQCAAIRARFTALGYASMRRSHRQQCR